MRMKKVANADMILCGFFNRACHYTKIHSFFSIVSRLGNGVFWYLLMILLPVIYGMEATFVTLQMVVTGISGLFIYKILKQRTERPRPYMVNEAIKLGTQPLDQYSFPSGHTLHAVGFSVIACYHYPELNVILVPIVILVAMSRMVLGLHYPSDVLVGAGIGILSAALTLKYVVI